MHLKENLLGIDDQVQLTFVFPLKCGHSYYMLHKMILNENDVNIDELKFKLDMKNVL